jgi:serine protease Do
VAGSFGEVVETLRRSTVQVRTGRNGSGSGVIWSQDGQIVTNSHVVRGAGNSGDVTVELWDGRRVTGGGVKEDRQRDLAVLQVEPSGLTAVSPGDSNALRVGEFVIAVGNPFGFTGAASTGVIHRLSVRDGARRGFQNCFWVVSQLRLAPGNSGGPLANAAGEVVGLNTMIAGGLAFAIPAQTVVEFLRSFHTREAGLGVVVQPIPLGWSREFALIVLQVVPDSPAERGSLREGDILVGAGGKRFNSVQDLQNGIYASLDGIMELQFPRGASENIRTVAIRLSPASVRAA